MPDRAFAIVLAVLGGAVVIGIAGVVLLSVLGKPVPEILSTILSATVGTFGGLLASPPKPKGQ